MMMERECSQFFAARGPQGQKIRKSRLIKEFAIEVLDPLTPHEIKELAAQQALVSGQSMQL